MEIKINCENPLTLKNKIIEDTENGELRTWEIRLNDKNEKILTHTADQYADRALLVLTPDENKSVLFGHVKKWKNADPLDYSIKAIYIGKFIQAVITHYEQQFTDILILK